MQQRIQDSNLALSTQVILHILSGQTGKTGPQHRIVADDLALCIKEALNSHRLYRNAGVSIQAPLHKPEISTFPQSFKLHTTASSQATVVIRQSYSIRIELILCTVDPDILVVFHQHEDVTVSLYALFAMFDVKLSPANAC